jgi:hypothetical protein
VKEDNSPGKSSNALIHRSNVIQTVIGRQSYRANSIICTDEKRDYSN